MTTSPAAARRLQHPADPYVLASRPLRPGARRAATSRFGDDVWDLTPALLQRHKNALILNFPTLPARFRQAVKDPCYALLARDLPPGERESTPDTIRVYFTALKQFLTWADQRGIPALRVVTAADLDAYNEHLLASGWAVTYQAQRRQGVRLLWLYAGKLTSDALAFDPALVPSWAGAPASSRAAENATLRIPEQVISPLLTWALVWINELADDVIAALEEWRLLHANTQPNRARRHAPACTDRAGSLEQLLQRYRAENRPLPGGTDGGPVLAHLAREVGCTPGAFRTERCRELPAAAAELGIAEGAYLRWTTPLPERADNGQLSAPWITASSTATRTAPATYVATTSAECAVAVLSWKVAVLPRSCCMRTAASCGHMVASANCVASWEGISMNPGRTRDPARGCGQRSRPFTFPLVADRLRPCSPMSWVARRNCRRSIGSSTRWARDQQDSS